MNSTQTTSSVQTNVLTQNLEVFDNTSESAIQINESKARLIYSKYFKSASGGTVLSLFGIFLSSITTLFTATFHDVFEIEGSASILTSIFVILTVVSGVFAVVWLFRWVHSKITLNESAFISELKGGSAKSKQK